MTNGEFFDEIKGLLNNEEIPQRVSNRLLWGALSVVYHRQEVILKNGTERDKKIARLELAYKILGGLILAMLGWTIFS